MREMRSNLDQEVRQPADAVADAANLVQRGLAAQRGGSPAEAERLFDEALRIDPAHVDALLLLGVCRCQLGLALHLLDRDEEAIACFARALQRDAGYWQACVNRALVFEKLGHHALALAELARALALRPDDPQIRFNAAVCRLRTGDFAGGWPLFEARRRLAARRVARQHDEAGLWLGADDISGKTLLLHAEHGLGDTIQFCRYAPLAAARGARVWIEAPPALLPLLQSLRGVERVVAQAAATFDRHTPMLSLPLAFGTAADSIPRAVPYLARRPIGWPAGTRSWGRAGGARASAWRRRATAAR